MAIEKVGATLPAVTASSDLSTKQYLFVKIDGQKTVGVAGAGEAIDGVLQNKPISGQAATVWGPGSLSKVYSSAAIAAGAFVTPAASGKAVTAASGNYIAGRVLEAATAADQLISVWITQPGRLA